MAKRNDKRRKVIGSIRESAQSIADDAAFILNGPIGEGKRFMIDQLILDIQTLAFRVGDLRNIIAPFDRLAGFRKSV
jgi:hypothetical protein